MKKTKVTIFCAVLAILLCVLCVPVAADAAGFADWEPGAWYAPGMAWCVEQGYFTGTNEGRIEAERPITRAEFLAVTVRYFQYSAPGDITFLNDVSPADWFYNAVAIGYGAGISQGVGEASFEPYRKISREQAFTMFIRGLRPAWKTYASLSGYSDADSVSPWARDPVGNIIALGIIEGYEDHTLRPQKEISRAEVAQMLYRAFQASETAPNPGNQGNESKPDPSRSSDGGSGGNEANSSTGGGSSTAPVYEYVLLDPQNGQAVIRQRIVSGHISAPAVPERSGYHFGGWYTEPDGGYRYDFERDRAASGLRLYARWYTPEEWELVCAMNGTGRIQIYADTDLWVSHRSGSGACAIRYAATNRTAAVIRLCTAEETLFEATVNPGDSIKQITLERVPAPGTYAAYFSVLAADGAAVRLDAVLHICEP